MGLFGGNAHDDNSLAMFGGQAYYGSIAIGQNAEAAGNSIAIGPNSGDINLNDASEAIAIGNQAVVNGRYAVVIGYNTSTSDYGIAIGKNAIAQSNSVAIGETTNDGNVYAGIYAGFDESAKQRTLVGTNIRVNTLGPINAFGNDINITEQETGGTSITAIGNNIKWDSTTEAYPYSDQDCLIIGNYPDMQGTYEASARFVVGAGSSDTDRQNPIFINNSGTTISAPVSLGSELYLYGTHDFLLGNNSNPAIQGSDTGLFLASHEIKITSAGGSALTIGSISGSQVITSNVPFTMPKINATTATDSVVDGKIHSKYVMNGNMYDTAGYFIAHGIPETEYMFEKFIACPIVGAGVDDPGQSIDVFEFSIYGDKAKAILYQDTPNNYIEVWYLDRVESVAETGNFGGFTYYPIIKL